MNTRTLLIIAALALPPVALAIIVQSGPGAQKKSTKLATGAPAANTGIAPGAISNEPVRLPALEPSRAEQKFQRAEAALKNRRKRVAHRLEQLKKMKPSDWPAELLRNPKAPPTLEEAIERNTFILQQLQKMTPEEWAAGKRPRPPLLYNTQTPAPTAAPAAGK
jgi:hypothetical protein